MRLRLENLSKKFTSLRGEVVAVEDISLQVQEGEFFVLVGPSGCGKSTLLNLIAGLEKPTGGEIWFQDRLVASAGKKISFTPRERNVAMVFQSYALYPHLNVFENIAFPLRVSRVREQQIKEAVKTAASTMEIVDLLRSKPAELSGGQRQRVAIARAIVRHPDLFLLDEPLSNLDAQLRSSMRVELKSLQQHLGVTTVYVTHDQVEAMTLGDRIAVLREGKLEQVGTPEELYAKPETTFVASFIGSPAMNLVRTSFVDVDGEFRVLIGEKHLRMPEASKAKFRALRSGECVFGIRPEDIRVSPAQPRWPLRAKIHSIEPLGKEMLLHLSAGDHILTALTTHRGFQEREEIEVELELEKAHILEVPD